MAVCPFCLPWPRTSVTVMPERLSFARASFTSSTLLGRMMAFSSFIRVLQRALQGGGERLLVGIGQFRASLRNVEHVDGFGALRRDEHQIDLRPAGRDRGPDAVQQPELIGRHDLDYRVSGRGAAVAIDDGGHVVRTASTEAELTPPQSIRDVRAP